MSSPLRLVPISPHTRTHTHTHSACGGVICDECSYYKPLPDLGYNKKERVCESCVVARHQKTQEIQDEHTGTRRRLESLDASHSQNLVKLAQTEAEFSRTIETHAEEQVKKADAITERDDRIAACQRDAALLQQMHDAELQKRRGEAEATLRDAHDQHGRAVEEHQEAHEAVTKAHARSESELVEARGVLDKVSGEKDALSAHVDALNDTCTQRDTEVARLEGALREAEAQHAEEKRRVEADIAATQEQLAAAASEIERHAGQLQEQEDGHAAKLAESQDQLGSQIGTLEAEVAGQKTAHQKECHTIAQVAANAGKEAATALRRDHARRTKELHKNHAAALKTSESRHQVVLDEKTNFEAAASRSATHVSEHEESARHLKGEVERLDAKLREAEQMRALAEENAVAHQRALLEANLEIQGRSARSPSHGKLSVVDDQVTAVAADVADLKKLLERSGESIEECQRQSSANLSGSMDGRMEGSPFAGTYSPVNAAYSADRARGAPGDDDEDGKADELAALRAALRERDDENKRLNDALEAASRNTDNQNGMQGYGSQGNVDDLYSDAERQTSGSQGPGEHATLWQSSAGRCRRTACCSLEETVVFV